MRIRRFLASKVWFLALVLIVLVLFGVFRYSRPVKAVSAQAEPAATIAPVPVTLPWPDYGQAAVGTIKEGVLATNGPQTPAPTASVAKIMTALSVLKQKPLGLKQQGPMITITAQDVGYYNTYFEEDGSLARVALGEQISEYQALQALLLPSANNFADTLAVWAFGSKDAYLTYANHLARQMDMHDSTFTDPSGFLPTTVSTAHDLVLLGQAAMAQPVIAQISAQSTAVIPVAGEIHNVNVLLGTAGIDGIKTGNTNQAGGVFLFSSRQTVGSQTIETIGAIMGAPDLPTALRSSPGLATATAQNFSERAVADKGKAFGSYTMPWDNSTVKVVPAQNVSITAWNGTPVTVKSELETMTGPQPKGTRTGTLTVSAGAQTTKVPLVLQSDTTAPSASWKLTRS